MEIESRLSKVGLWCCISLKCSMHRPKKQHASTQIADITCYAAAVGGVCFCSRHTTAMGLPSVKLRSHLIAVGPCGNDGSAARSRRRWIAALRARTAGWWGGRAAAGWWVAEMSCADDRQPQCTALPPCVQPTHLLPRQPLTLCRL